MHEPGEQILQQGYTFDSEALNWIEPEEDTALPEITPADPSPNQVVERSRNEPEPSGARAADPGIATHQTNQPPRGDLDGYVWAHRISGQRFKRLTDIIGSAVLLCILSPVMVCIFILVRLQDGGPGLYRHTRIGHGGRTFSCLKFRSMCVDAERQLDRYLSENEEAAREWEESRKLRKDPRISGFGHFLRKSSLDELPQFFNVLIGDMSLVGPRPITAAELSRYGLQAIHYLRMRPGISGLWQVSGRSDAGYQERVRLDRAYSLHRSFWTDVKILVLTVPAVLLSRGAV